MACYCRLIDAFKCLAILLTFSILKLNFYTTNHPEITTNEEPDLKPFDLNVKNYLVPPLFLTKPDLPRSVDILIMVTSAPKNIQARNEIRNTWGHPQVLEKYRIGLVFIAGQCNQCTPEINLNQDILNINIVDNYMNLTLKSVYMLKYLEELQLNKARKVSVLKTDDDCYVNVPALARLVKHNKPGLNIIGFPLVDTSNKKLKVNRPKPGVDNKWAIPYWMYQGEYFPLAVSGSGYVFPFRKASCLFQSAFKIPLITLEDVYVTGKKCSCEVKKKSNLSSFQDFLPKRATFHSNLLVIFSTWASKTFAT